VTCGQVKPGNPVLKQQPSKMPLLLSSKLKWHPDQHIFTVFANASGVKQSSIFIVITIAGSLCIILSCCLSTGLPHRLRPLAMTSFVMTMKIRESCSCLQQK